MEIDGFEGWRTGQYIGRPFAARGQTHSDTPLSQASARHQAPDKRRRCVLSMAGTWGAVILRTGGYPSSYRMIVVERCASETLRHASAIRTKRKSSNAVHWSVVTYALSLPEVSLNKCFYCLDEDVSPRFEPLWERGLLVPARRRSRRANRRIGIA
jgi:hypothetical protein